MVIHFDHLVPRITMPAAKPEDLRKAYKKERDPKVVKRMAAVNMVCMNNESIQHVADSLMQCPNWVSFWVERFREGGIDALRDLPKSGRPPKVKLKKIEKMLYKTDSIIAPMQLREDICKKYGVKYHITNVRKIMRKLGLTAKTVRRIHINRAEIDEIKKWQRSAKRQISRLKKLGFAVVVFDEAIFIDDPTSGAKYWSPEGQPIITTYKGRHGRVVAYGSIGIDGRQFFRTYDKFDKETVLQYLKELARHFGKVAIIMDNAPQHKGIIVSKFLKGNKNVKVIWLPTATPELSVTEEYWHQSKRDVLVSEYYGTVGQMRHAMSEYFRTARPGLDAMKFICRKSLDLKNI